MVQHHHVRPVLTGKIFRPDRCDQWYCEHVRFDTAWIFFLPNYSTHSIINFFHPSNILLVCTLVPAKHRTGRNLLGMRYYMRHHYDQHYYVRNIFQSISHALWSVPGSKRSEFMNFFIIILISMLVGQLHRFEGNENSTLTNQHYNMNSGPVNKTTNQLSDRHLETEFKRTECIWPVWVVWGNSIHLDLGSKLMNEENR